MRTRVPAIKRTHGSRAHATRAFCGSALLMLLVGHPAIAATPADNKTLEFLANSSTLTEIASIPGGFLPPPLGTGSEAIGVAMNIASKNIAASFDGPGDWSAPLNSPGQNSQTGTNCVYEFEEPVVRHLDDRMNGLESDYSRTLFFPLQNLEDVWGDLNDGDNVDSDQVRVYHPNADVTVSVTNPYLGQAGLLENPEFPSGRHVLNWKAETQIHPVLDVALPAALFAASSFSEYDSALFATTEAAKTSIKKQQTRAKLIRTAIKLADGFGLLSGTDPDPSRLEQWKKRTSRVSATNRDSQILTVWDSNKPYVIDADNLPVTGQSRQNTIVEQSLTLEATDFGGVRFSRVREELMKQFVPVDDCGSAFDIIPALPDSYLLAVDVDEEVNWTINELGGGPYKSDFPIPESNLSLDGDQIRMSFLQRVKVLDRQAPLLLPPAGFARYDEDGIDLTVGEFPLGQPQVVDLADPTPSVSHDAPDFLAGPPPGADGIRHIIEWTASDGTNQTLPHTQIVTLKRPGTNTAPTAVAANANAITSKAVDIQLTGVDTDMIDGMVDPLAFKIEASPQYGQFEAPLYPHFIEDFRLSPTGERDEGDNTSRVSPLLHLADDFRLAAAGGGGIVIGGPELRHAFINREICVTPSAESIAAFNGKIPVNFVYRPSHVYVDDDGFYFVRDSFFECNESSVNASEYPRISKWNPDGELVDVLVLKTYPSTDYKSMNCSDDPSYPGSPSGVPFVDTRGTFWITFKVARPVVPGSGAFSICSIPNTLDSFDVHGSFTVAGQEETGRIDNYPATTGIAGDENVGLIYESTRESGIYAHRYDRAVRLVGNLTTTGPDTIGSLDVSGISSTEMFHSLRIDTTGNIYVLQGDRIHKFAASSRTSASSWDLGEYIGWLGACDSNKVDPATGVPYSRCDVPNGRSKGFSCTDASCNHPATPGSDPGQFNAPASIEIDPRDVLYVADTGNSRVQRFGPDGTFAGEAKSTGTGVNQGDEPGFIIGNIGSPRQISVNSTAFFVMEPANNEGDEFLHSFKTSPFRDVTDSSATVRYVSDFNFQGNDSFAFSVDDGIDKSSTVAVNVNVTRAFRAPENLAATCFFVDEIGTPVPCTLDEDTSIYIHLSADDPDGFLSDTPFGLDTLSFDIIQQPENGTLILDDPALKTDNAITLLYTPKPNYNGSDSLTFTASDGVKTAAEIGQVQLSIIATPDPTVIDMGDPVTAARGFPAVMIAEFSDVDQDPDFQASLDSISWGDGSGASGPSWAGSGRYDANGREISPKMDFELGSGVLVGTHTYSSSGTFTTRSTMLNAPSDPFTESQGAGTVTVIEATVLNTQLTAPASAVDPDVVFPLELQVRNLKPEGWSGLTAANTKLSIEVPAGLTILSVDARCVQGSPILCDLGDLAPDALTTIALSARIDYAAAIVESQFTLTLQTTDDGPKISTYNASIASISIADDDDDGVFNVDDMFPDDPRWSVDSDGDGLADAWEIEFGFDPNAFDDVTQDHDGDGYSLIDEFLNGSVPWRDEIQTLANGHDIAAPDFVFGDDFGRVIAGGDINQDGYADTVVGAPFYTGGGAAFIVYGGPDGAQAPPQIVPPSGNMSQFGRSVAVGDWDGNGMPDLAIGSSGSFSIHYNNGQILDLPDYVAPNTGMTLASGDLDGDGIDDLLATARPTPEPNLISLYLSSDGSSPDTRFVTPTIIHSNPTVGLGDSFAIADIDGDASADLLIGAGFAGNGEVHAFLGAHNQWQAGTGLTTSFVLLAPAGNSRFAYSMASAADIGGDGIDDLVVGAYGTTGNVLVYDSASRYWDVPTGQASFAAASQVIGGLNDQFGVSVALGHLDTDTYADLVVGANRAGELNSEAVGDYGLAKIYRGSPTGLLPNSQVEESEIILAHMGYNVAIPGDINGDGFDDIAVGAPHFTAELPGFVRFFYHSFTASNAGPGTDSDGDGVADEFDAFPFNPMETQDSDGDGVGDNRDAFPLQAEYQFDSDADGMPDAYEVAYGLDPDDAADANGDLDGDGRNNVDEFQQGTAIDQDDVIPALMIPADIVVDAIGPLTNVSLGVASAVDVKDGQLVPTINRSGPFVSGRHEIEYSATDLSGNTATGTQWVDVIPMVNFSGELQYAAEGSQATIQVRLSGDAVNYPVSLSYVLSGSATEGDDFTIASNTLNISNSNVASIDVTLLADGLTEGDETIILTMGTPVNAIPGSTAAHTLQIVEGNIAPQVDLTLEQAGDLRSTIVSTDGDVALTLNVDDANPADSHVFDWSGSDNALVPSNGNTSPSFVVDPLGLTAGIYLVDATTTDSGTPGLSANANRLLRVVSEAPLFEPGMDSDGDGMTDIEEGLRDSNQNGISDYLDPTYVDNYLLTTVGENAGIQAPEGYRLSLGRTAWVVGKGAAVTLADIADFGSNGGAALHASDDRFDYSSGIFDFEVGGLPAKAATTEVVIPLLSPIPADARYRKYFENIGWLDFVEDERNALASALGSPGVCPAPGAADYSPGLTAGNHCLQLSLEDGGPNDTDGIADGVIRDPGGVATEATPLSLELLSLAASNATVNRGASNIVVVRFRLNSNSNQVQLSMLELAASGSGNDATDISAVTLWVDTNSNGVVDSTDVQIGQGSYQSDNGVLVMTLSTPQVLAVGSTDFLVSYAL